MRTFQQYIDGQFEDAGATFPSIDPATGEHWAMMPWASTSHRRSSIATTSWRRPAAALDYTRTKTVWLRTSDDPIPDPFVMR